MKFYDPGQETLKSKRKLPHWEQAGCVYFITFRLKDSIPRGKLADWNERRKLWLRSRGADPEISSRGMNELLSESQRKEYYQTFTKYYHELLDSGVGACELREPENAKIVADALMFFDGDRYEIYDFVVMPNHVHLLVEVHDGWDLRKLLHSWKGYMSREIHRRMNQSGTLWQHEYYDHLVRNETQFIRIQKYIRENPKQLQPHEYIHYSRTGL